ncbi:hypothetical protein [Hyphomicrobium sp.]|uniref:hypothetical protein n=1 Tax=Hyphomicrobium sp. TaxID=82 RepID=UPI001D39878E|nr:hypothetical protein [Hyphomicrobium sp.]MBY0559892.1 hypothetical protein [Hyphomicrobium sp.]
MKEAQRIIAETLQGVSPAVTRTFAAVLAIAIEKELTRNGFTIVRQGECLRPEEE